MIKYKLLSVLSILIGFIVLGMSYSIVNDLVEYKPIKDNKVSYCELYSNLNNVNWEIRSDGKYIYLEDKYLSENELNLDCLRKVYK